MARTPPILSFVAPSGTGKTTLLEGVVRSLCDRGLRIGVLKHDAHRLVLDKPGKDTWRLRRAGAWRAVIASSEQLGVFSDIDGAVTVGGMVGAWLEDADLVITEGFRRSAVPMVRVHRAAAADPTWSMPGLPIAWASDVPVDTTVPVLDLNDPVAVADFVVSRFLTDDAADPRRATLLLPMAAAVDAGRILTASARLGSLFAHVLVVHPPGVTPPDALDSVADIRPGDGVLGGLLTGLAAASTPDVLYLGPRHHEVSTEVVARLLRWGPRSADIVVPAAEDGNEPLLALYGSRCLPAIKGAVLSGELRMDGWWGQVRVHRLGPALWY